MPSTTTRAPQQRIPAGDIERDVADLALQLAADDALIALSEVRNFFVHGGRSDVDGDDLSMRMRQRCTTTHAVVDHHLHEEVSGRGTGSCPVTQCQQHLEDLMGLDRPL